ncbi:MAG: metallophosphoesterase family protein [Pedosphaera sp.]|nr:metallophosphoesterase family protein [Pedosphaera sp.]
MTVSKFHRSSVSLLALSAAVKLWTAISLAANPPRPLARFPYVQCASPTMIHIAWRTESPIDPIVRFGTNPSNLNLNSATNAIVVRASLGTNGQEMLPQWRALRTPENLRLPKLHSAPIGTFQYEVRLTDLMPDTRYSYAVFDGTERLTSDDESYQFTTYPPVGTVRPYQFWVLGDGGTGREPQYAVHQAMLDTTRKEGRPIDFWIYAGDMAYGTGRDVEFQARFFEAYDHTLRHKVCWPAMGNHEGFTSKGTTGIGPYYDAYIVPTRGEVGGVASGTEAYYSFDYGNMHFICLDSHDLDRKPTSAMAKWLQADLDKAQADWLIAFWHHPPYTKGSHDSDKEKDLTEMRRYIMPIIEAGGVDVVLTGHSHTYERSMLMDGAYATPTVSESVILDDGDGDPSGDGPYRKSAGIHAHEGTVQVVNGNAGQTLGRTGTLPVMKRTIVEHGSVLVNVNGDTLVGRMINRNGSQRDLFSIVKRGSVAVSRLPLPWQPPEYKKPTTETKQKAAPAVDHKILITREAGWEYLVGATTRGLSWTRLNFETQGWKTGTAAFGFGERTYKTELKDMRRKSTLIYLRKEFQIEQADRVTEMGLWIDYEDGFIAYINGHEVARVGVARSSGRNAQGIKPRDENGPSYIILKDINTCLKDGANLLAIEAHIASGESLNFRLDPSLIVED